MPGDSVSDNVHNSTANKSKMVLVFKSTKMEFSEQSQSKKIENFPRNVGR